MKYTINTIEQLKPILIGFRKSKRLSQKELAQKLGVSQQTYQVLESNPHKASVARLFRVLSLLNVNFQLIDADVQTPSQDYVREPQQEDW